MSYLELYNALREEVPDLADPEIRQSECACTPHTLSSSKTPLHTLKKDNNSFNAAAYSLDRHLRSLILSRATPKDPIILPGPILSEDLHHVVDEADTQTNFDMAVGVVVGHALSALVPPGLTSRVVDSPRSITWIWENELIVDLVFKTHHECDNKTWQEIRKMVIDRKFPWDGQGGKVVGILSQIWGRLNQDKPPRLAALCTYRKLILFYKSREDPHSMMCSRIYECRASGSLSYRSLLTANLLAALRDAGGPAAGDVAFRTRPQTTTEIQSIAAEQAQARADASASVIRYLSNLPPPKWKFDNVPTVWWKIYPQLGLKGFTAVPPQFILEHRDEQRYTRSEIPLPDGAAPENAAVVAEDVLVVNKIGSVCVGSLRGGPRVVLKSSEDDADPDGWEELYLEAFSYHKLTMAGLARYIPYCHGLWQEQGLTLLIVEHVGTSFEDWSDLDEAQWALLCNALRALHTAGFHHGDLLPRNVCVNDAGQLRFIDLACVAECRCSGTCRDVDDLESDSGRTIWPAYLL